MIPVWYVRCWSSPELWRGVGEELTLSGFLQRDLSVVLVKPRPTPFCRFVSLSAALSGARDWIDYRLQADDYFLRVEVLDPRFVQVHEFRGHPVRVAVTTRTLFAIANIEHA